jgi:hypothetical protein
MAFKLIESHRGAVARCERTHLGALVRAGQDSRTANSSNEPTSREVTLKSRDMLIHTY